MSEAIVPGKTTPMDLDRIARRIVGEAGGTPSFLGYRGFPAATCISVNEVVVHGIPNEVPLQEGDIIGLDMGVHLDGWHADGAWSYPVGAISPEAQRLLNVSRESLFQGPREGQKQATAPATSKARRAAVRGAERLTRRARSGGPRHRAEPARRAEVDSLTSASRARGPSCARE